MILPKKSKQHFIHIGKKLAKFSLLILLLLSIVLAISWCIFSKDHPYIIQKIKTKAFEKFNTAIDLESYELVWGNSFPNIQVKVEGIQIANQSPAAIPILKINTATTQLNLWKLKSGIYDAQPIFIDSIWVHIHRDALGNKNTQFKKNDTSTKNKNTENPKVSSSSTFLNFPKLNINFLDFFNQNIESNKWQRAQLLHPDIQLEQNTIDKIEFQLQSDCHFDGLVFKDKEGGFLLNQNGKLKVQVQILENKKHVNLKNSSLEVDKMKFNLAGDFYQADTNRLFLQIQTDAVKMKEVLPLLSKKINYVLRDIKIDQPIQADFSIDKYLISGRRELINLDFATNNASLKFQKTTMTSTTLRGNFSNDCDKDGIGDFKNSCLTVHQLDGDIFDILSTQLKGKITRLNNPLVEVDGKMFFGLPSLNTLLAANDKMTFTNGHATVKYQYQGVLDNLLKSPFDEQEIKLQGDAQFYDLTVKTDNRYAPSPSLSGLLSFDENQAILDDILLDWMGSKIAISGQVGNLPEFLFYEEEALNTNLKLHFDQIDFETFIAATPEKTKINQERPMTAKSTERLFRRLASSINGKIQLQVDSIFLDTLFLTKLQSRFRLLTPRRPEFIDSSMIRIDKLTAKFMGKTPVFIDMGLTRDSITDLWVKLNLPSAVQPANFFLPKNIELSQGEANLNIYANLPLRTLFEPKKLMSKIDYRGQINFKEIEILTGATTLPIRKLSGPLVFDKQQIDFDSLRFFYEASPFLLVGDIQNYYTFQNQNNTKGKLDFKIKGDFLNLKKKKNTDESKPSTASQKAILSPVLIFKNLDTIFQFATGKIDLQLDSILTNQLTIYPFLLQAQLLANKNFGDQYQLVVDSFNFNFGKKNSVKGHAIISNPEQPLLAANFKTNMKFNQLGKLLPSDFIEMKDGYFVMDMDYQSQLYDTINAENYISKAKIDGTAEIVDGKIFYNYRDFEFDNIYSHFSFDEKAISIRDIDLKVNNNRIFGSGESKDFFPFFIFPNRRVHLEMKLTSPFFDFGNFTAPHGLGKDTLLVVLQDTSTTAEEIMVNAGTLIDQLLEKGAIEMTTDIKKLVYQKFLAKNISGKVLLQTDSVQLENLIMDVADGSFALDGLISNVAMHRPILEIKMQMKENNLKEIFRQFEDFGQKDFGYKNLKGDASAELLFKTKINSNYAILPETMQGDLQLKLIGGQLTDLAFFQKMPKFIYRKRKLDNIYIDTVETNIHIRGNNFYLEKSYFRSSPFHFNIQGVYNLANPLDTRILLSIPFSNLYKKHFTAEEIKSKTAQRKGFPILIEAKYKNDKIKFRWKLFNGKKNKKKYLLND